jgi:hypothetical protein
MLIFGPIKLESIQEVRMKRIPIVFSVFLVVLSANCILAETSEPTLKWITNTQTKTVGSPTCVEGKEQQTMALEATFSDGSKSVLMEWAQSTGKSCTVEEKARGKMPDKPNPEGAQAAMKGEEPGDKARGCGYYYLWWDYGTYYYVEYYDEYWRFCYWRKIPKW